MQHAQEDEFDEWEETQHVEEQDVAHNANNNESGLESGDFQDAAMEDRQALEEEHHEDAHATSEEHHEEAGPAAPEQLADALGDMNLRREQLELERGSLSNVLAGTAHELEVSRVIQIVCDD